MSLSEFVQLLEDKAAAAGIRVLRLEKCRCGLNFEQDLRAARNLKTAWERKEAGR